MPVGVQPWPTSPPREITRCSGLLIAWHGNLWPLFFLPTFGLGRYQTGPFFYPMPAAWLFMSGGPCRGGANLVNRQERRRQKKFASAADKPSAQGRARLTSGVRAFREGRYAEAFKRVAKLDKKAGPFDALFCVGAFNARRRSRRR